MNSLTRKLIITGGVLNGLLALFHIFLAYNIYILYSSQEFYPLMQMLNVGGSLVIFFLAYTSLFYADELINTKVGKAVIILNIIFYAVRTGEEFILVSKPALWVIAICMVITIIYLIAYLRSTNVSKLNVIQSGA